MLNAEAQRRFVAAAKKGNLAEVTQLFSSGTVAITGDVLCGAAENGHLSVVQYLIEKGADIDVKDGDGRTALHFAASKGHLSVVQYLIGKGADIHVKNRYGLTALHWAAWNSHLSVVQCLTAKGADIDVKDGYGWTALHYAAESGHTDVVQHLLSCGSVIDEQDSQGQTSLLFVCRFARDTTAIPLLLDYRADPHLKDEEGKTALDWLRKRPSYLPAVPKEMKALLKQAMIDSRSTLMRQCITYVRQHTAEFDVATVQAAFPEWFVGEWFLNTPWHASIVHQLEATRLEDASIAQHVSKRRRKGSLAALWADLL